MIPTLRFASVAGLIVLAAAACSGDVGAGSGTAVDAGGDLDGGFDDASDSAGDGSGSGEDAAADPGRDSDGDGIIDTVEDSDGDGAYDSGTAETDLGDSDTDNDGIEDGAEDADRDGVVDEGETDPRLADTDGDNLDDGAEQAEGTDPLDSDTDDDWLSDGHEVAFGTDPLVPDTDEDGLPDGDEDRDADGTVDPDETDPLVADSDGDGTTDGLESLPLACARISQPRVRTLSDQAADFTLTLGEGFAALSFYEESSVDDRLLRAGYFDHPQYSGAVISRRPDSSAGLSEAQMAIAIVRLGRAGRIIDRVLRPLTTWDGFGAVSAELAVRTTAPVEASILRDRAAAALMNLSASAPLGAPAASGPVATDWTLRVTLVSRSRQREILLLSVVPASGGVDASTEAALDDLASTTVLGQFGDTTEPFCEPLVITAERFDVDFLWVVDDTPSMVADRQTAAAAATRFFESLSRSVLDFRIAVVSTQLTNEEWYLVEPAFSTELADFQAQLQSPARQSGPPGAEFGIETALNINLLASNGFGTVNQTWREDAKRFIIFFTDENDSTVEQLAESGDAGCNTALDSTLATCDYVNDAIATFQTDGVTAFAITGDAPAGCTSTTGPGASSEAGSAYIRIAFETGGSFASICAPDIGESVDRIVRDAFGAVGTYALTAVPVYPALRLARNGALQPRSTLNGWTYDASSGRVVFAGASRPGIDDDLAAGYLVYVDQSPDPTGFVPAD